MGGVLTPAVVVAAETAPSTASHFVLGTERWKGTESSVTAIAARVSIICAGGGLGGFAVASAIGYT